MHKITNKLTGEVKVYTEAEFEAERTRMILDWQKKKGELDVAKEAEMKAREALVEFASDPNKEKGTENVELGNGYKLKIVKGIRFDFVKREDGKVDRDTINAALDKIEATGDAGKLIAERLVKWSPELSLTEYNLLSDEYKAEINKVLITKPTAPSVSMVEPKAKK